MSRLITARNTSEAWVSAAASLLANGNRVTHLMVEIAEPQVEVPAARKVVDRFFSEYEALGYGTVDKVADTLFPSDYYDPTEPDSAAKLFERWQEAREFESKTVPAGDYFGRMVDYPASTGAVNQLQRVIERLKWARGQGRRNGNITEVAIDFADTHLRIQDPGKDTSIMGFPCLSHVSITLADGRIHGSAVYRAQDFTLKAYGNYVGLARVIVFLAEESGFDPGELLCVATCATLEYHKAGATRVRKLISDCNSELEKLK